MTDLAKAYVKGHARADGTYVKPYNTKVQSAAAPAHHFHPQFDDKGAPVKLHAPSNASAASTWHNPQAVATFVPDGDVPLGLNGIPFREWKDHPVTADGWDYVDGVDDDLDEPPFVQGSKKYAASGVVIEEPDGRVWLIAPSNQFGGYEASFPKGTAEEGLSLQANAVKEAFEESGLKVRITGFLGDFERTMSKARIYRAQRIGGTPTAMGWESQAVHLVPKDKLYDHLNMWSDHGIAEVIGAGPAPEPPKKAPTQKSKWGNEHSDLFD
jgi:8-oxo-dGTP pyrophosphatase MutT (NUDIX family)